MNHLLKRQPSPCGIVECLLNNVNHSTSKHCFCRNCDPHHPNFRSNVQGHRGMGYLSALQVRLDKKRISKKNEYISKRINPIITAKRLTEMLKVMPMKPSSKKLLFYRKKISESNGPLGWNSRYNVDCTKSYDPSLLNCNLEVERFYRPVETEPILKSDPRCDENLESLNVNSSQFSRLLEENHSERKKQRVISVKQQPVENVRIKEPESILSINKELSESMLESSAEKQKYYSKWDFDQFAVNLSQDHSLLQFLNSSLDICITNDMLKEACILLETFRRKKRWKNFIINHPKVILNVYNSVLYALSSKGYWYLMKTVTECMEEDKIRMNCESFAALLHCLAKVRESGNEEFVLQEVGKLLNSIFVNNISLNDIFCKTTLTKDASEKILKIIREVVPSFEIEPDIMELSSDCPLLRNLHGSPTNLQPQVEGMEVEKMERLVEEQMLVEKNSYMDVKAVSRGRPGPVPDHLKEKVDNLKREWRATLTEAVSSLQRIKRAEFNRGQQLNLHIHLSSLPVDKVVDVLMETIQTLVEFSGGFSPSSDQFHKMLGWKLFQCYQLRKKDVSGFTDKTQKLFKKYVAWFANPSGPAMNSRQKWQMIIQDSEKSSQLDPQIIQWPDEVLVKLGKLFLNVIFKEIKFTTGRDSNLVTVPVLYTILRFRGSGFREEIKCHPKVASLFDNLGFDILHFRSEEIPMVCPPKPWKAVQHGGYLFLPTDFIRKPRGIQGKVIRLEDVPLQHLYPSFDSLNALQSVPWMINEDVLDVALEVFRSGGSEKLSVPLFPERPPPREQFSEDLSYEERQKLNKERMELVKELANNYGLWCEALYRLSLANHFRKKIFWMPQNCDFRGRVYPVPPLINHIGSDLFRSLLVFAKGKPLGPNGLDWIKIHLVNLIGTHKKKTVKDRLDYANEILPVILDSAEKPLTGKKWWMESEEPWQTLATCMELKKAISSPNPEAYICRFPIHQDGSCNGLQHYAALGRDLIGAESVNLCPFDKPQDVYGVVAGLIDQERAKDAADGVEIAKILEGFVERKVVKQTVMTTVYGVTSYGAKLQIAKRLEEIPNFPSESIGPAATYLSEKTFFCLQKMFTSAKQIQEWFINCSAEICQMKDYVQWMSPIGLPVLQSYAKYRVNMESRKRLLLPDTMKQKNAFPPNFIHSLDSAHMMLTALYCEQAGLTFAAIHDCFWTHPNTVDTMNRICREQFISLHSQPILEELAHFFKKTYAKSGVSEKAIKVFGSVPKKGSFDLTDVMKSVYFFS